MAKTDLDISVLIPTYNRAEILRETLEAMCSVELDGLAAEFVVIDNNSKDHTKDVVGSFTDRLPVRYLFETRPGKNCALNKALDTVELGSVVVFTDDDVTPRRDWLKQIIGSHRRHPQCAIGGGKVVAAWPGGRDPAWLPFAATTGGLQGHDLGPREELYPRDIYPTGGNLWIVKRLFTGGLRYDESIGPSPVKRAMGSETSLLIRLRQEGHCMVYCPDSVVLHRIEPWLVAARGIRRRAYTMGRGAARVNGPANAELRRNHRWRWRLRCMAALGVAVLRLAGACLSPTPARRIGRSLDPISDIAYNIELFRRDRTAAQ